MNPCNRKGSTSLEDAIESIANRLADLDRNSNKIKPRDLYAGLAMAGMLSHGDTRDRSTSYLSRKSFEIADEMMEAR